MTSPRLALKQGKGRFASYLVAILLSVLIVKAGLRGGMSISSMLDGMRNIAFVNAGFIVAAFNLRFRAIDLMKFDGFTLDQVTAVNLKVSKCCERLTHLVLLFVFTSAIMALAPILGHAPDLAGYVLGFTIWLFLCGLFSFVYILFAFESLEHLLFKLSAREAAEREDSNEPG